MTTLTRSAREEVLRSVLWDFGYGNELVEVGFPVWVNGTTHAADLVGFGRQRQHDMSTATVTGIVAENQREIEDGFRIARALATPALLVALPEQAVVWSVEAAGLVASPILAEDYASFQEAARPLRRDLSPTMLLEAKSENRQLPLFPLDVTLFQAARADSSERLSRRVNRAMALALKNLIPDDSGSKMEKRPGW